MFFFFCFLKRESFLTSLFFMKGFLKFTITEASVKTITHVHKYNPESKSKHFDSIHTILYSVFFLSCL